MVSETVSNPRQDWVPRVQSLIDEVPLSMDEDGENPERRAALGRVRCSIASQWARLLHRAQLFGSSDAGVTAHLEFLEATIAKIAQEHGQTMAFCPSPQLKDLYPRPGDLVLSPATSDTPAAEETYVDHDFKYLQVGNDVWTVLQVSWGPKISVVL